MAAVVALAFGLRVLQLGAQSLWDNETHPVYMARRGLLYIIQHLEADHVPLHYALLWGWGQAAGWSEFSVRFVSVCAGLLTVPLLYQIVRLVAPRRAALIGAGILAVAPFHIYYSQETRMYALACMFVTLAAYGLIAARLRGSGTYWALYGAASAAALYTFYYAGLAFIALNIPLLLVRRRPLGWWLANAGAVLALIPWLVLVEGRFARFIGDRVALAGPAPFSLSDVLQSPSYLAFGSTLEVRSGLIPGLLLGVFGLACAGRQLASRRLPDRLLAAWGLGTVLCLDLLVLVLPIYDPRYLLVSLPGWIALIAAGARNWPQLLRWAALPAGVLFLEPAGVSLYNNYFDGAFQRPDYRDVFATVRAQTSPDDLLIYDTPFQPWAPDYYFRDGPIPAIGLPDVRAKDGSVADLAELSGHADWAATERDLAADSDKYDGIWLVLYGQPNLDPDNRVESWLDEHRLAVSNNWINGVRLKHYLPAPGPVATARLPGGAAPNLDFGPIRLLRVQAGQPTAAHRLPVRLLWTATTPLQTAYSESLQLFDPQGHRVAQKDGPLLWGGLGAGDWQSGLAYYDSVTLELPAAVPTGLYQLRLSVYDTDRRPAGEQRTIAVIASTSAAVEVHPEATTSAGWSLETVQLGADSSGRLLVALTSRVQAAPARDYTWFTHLLDSKGVLVGQDDHPPLVATSAWRPGEERTDWFSVAAPPNAGAALEIGAYDSAGRRVTFQSADGSRADHVLVAVPKA